MENLQFGADLLDSARENFVGRISAFNYPCHCAVCEDGAAKLRQKDPSAPIDDRLHIEIEPLTTYEKNQHQWLIPRKTKRSAWGAFNMALSAIGEIEAFSGGESGVVGRVYEWSSQETQVGIGDRTTEVWVPIRVIPEAEIEELSGGQETEGKKM